MSSVCPNGHSLEGSFTFCPDCGAKIDASGAPTAEIRGSIDGPTPASTSTKSSGKRNLIASLVAVVLIIALAVVISLSHHSNAHHSASASATGASGATGSSGASGSAATSCPMVLGNWVAITGYNLLNNLSDTQYVFTFGTTSPIEQWIQGELGPYVQAEAQRGKQTADQEIFGAALKECASLIKQGQNVNSLPQHP